MSEEQNELEFISILDGDYARAILEATRREQLSAKSLSEQCGMSISTVSRRVNRLLEHDLLIERTHIDPDGHQYNEYEAKLHRVDVTLLETGFEVKVAPREDAADRFTRIWGNMRNE